MDDTKQVGVTCVVFLEDSVGADGLTHRVTGALREVQGRFTVSLETKWHDTREEAVEAFYEATDSLEPHLREAVETMFKKAIDTCNTPPTDTDTTSPTSSESSTPESSKD